MYGGVSSYELLSQSAVLDAAAVLDLFPHLQSPSKEFLKFMECHFSKILWLDVFQDLSEKDPFYWIELSECFKKPYALGLWHKQHLKGALRKRCFKNIQKKIMNCPWESVASIEFWRKFFEISFHCGFLYKCLIKILSSNNDPVGILKDLLSYLYNHQKILQVTVRSCGVNVANNF